MTQESTRCQHHWIIDPAAGPASKGVCKLCGEEREFDNSSEAMTWWAQYQVRRRPAEDTDSEEKEPTMPQPRRERHPERGPKPNMQGVERDAQWLERNRDVLGLLLQGVSVAKIAQRLGKSKSSIGNIRERLRDLGELETGA